ncbi:hypothetical protein ABFS83_14G092500 [Erythranthe nasuta]
MESRLTQSEMDAVLQLIQLSGNSGGDHDFHVFWVNIPAAGGGGKREIKLLEEEEREESVGETSWSNQEKLSEDDDDDDDEEALPRRRRKIRSIVDIYRKTPPFIKNNRLHKRPKI